MHRGRLFGVFVDTPRADADRSVEFWSEALGATVEPEDEDYTALKGATGRFGFVVQAVDDAPRYHLDIETDDIAAETARLIGLGATEVGRHGGWVVLRAPGGQLLCVVSVQSPQADFDAKARTWDS